MAEVSHDARAQRILAQLQKYRDRIRNMDDVMTQIGVLGVAASQKAFREQSLDGDKWPVRYPNQADPFINKAGALSDWASGRKSPKPNRFDRTPALIDTRNLKNSLTSKSGSEFARWGTNMEYARDNQDGGESEIKVSPSTKQRMKEWFYTPKGKRKKARTKGRVTDKASVSTGAFEQTERGLEFVRRTHMEDRERDATRADYIGKFGWLLNPKRMDKEDVVVTKIHARPFVGYTDEMERQVKKLIKRHVQRGP